MLPGFEPPVYEIREFLAKRTRYCFIVVMLNEGERITGQLERMRAQAELADIVLADGGSTDGSTGEENLRAAGVRSLLTTAERGLCTALRMALAYAIEQGYEGVVTVDGNGKDGVESLVDFIAALDDGYDFVQGSRFLAGGHHENTPMERYLGVRLVMSPLLSLGSRYWYTDVTNGFKACSRRFLTDRRVQPIRRIFVRFNLQPYLNYRAARLGFRVRELPVRRVYPSDGSIPTKIRDFETKWLNVKEMLLTATGAYNPSE